MQLSINWFKTALSSETQALPAQEFPTEEAASEAMRSDGLRGIILHRIRSAKGEPTILVALSGADGKRPKWKERVFPIKEYPPLFAHVIENALTTHLRSREGIRAFRNKWGVEAVKEDEGFQHPAVRLLRGVTANSQADDDCNLGVILNWRVRGEFYISLQNSQIASRAINAPVELRVDSTNWPLANELKRYNRRYLGRVINIKGHTAEVSTRDGEHIKVPAEYLFFEGSPARIRDYESTFMRQARSISAWMRLQQLSFALTPQGKRNASIFRDRLRAIIAFVGDGADFIICETKTYAGGQVTVDLKPQSLLADPSA